MKYSIKLRLKSATPGVFLIELKQEDDLVKAFEIANDLLTSTNNQDEHFVEIIDNSNNEKIASINDNVA